MDRGLETDNEAGQARHQREDPRDSMLLLATIRVGDEGAPEPLRVRNLSAGGLMGEHGPVTLSVGKAVSVDLRNIGTVKGRVAWTDETRFGIAFDQPIDPALGRRPVGKQRANSALVAPPRDRPWRPGVRVD